MLQQSPLLNCRKGNARARRSLLPAPIPCDEPGRSTISCSLAETHRLAPAGLAFLIALGLASCQQEASRTENLPRPVQTETVNLTDYAPTVRLTGEVRARFESDLAFRISGRITQRMVDVGDHVTAGQVLARLDPEQEQATVTAAEASVLAAEAVLRHASSTYGRQKALFAQGFTTKREHDQAEESFRTAQASLDTARSQLGTTRNHLSDTVLRAGVPGVITGRKVETGQVVQIGQTAFSIAQDGPRDAVFNVYESILSHKPADRAIELTLVSDPTIKTIGAVREISPTVDSSNGTVRVKIGIEHPPAAMTLGAAVIGEAGFLPRKLVVLPWTALSSRNGQPAVWTVDPRTKAVSLKPIAIAGYETGKVLVRDGLQPGEIVVTKGAQFLRPQQVVAFADGAAP